MWIPKWAIIAALAVFIIATPRGRWLVMEIGAWILMVAIYVLTAPIMLYQFLNRPVDEVFPPKPKQAPAEKPQ